MIVSPVIYNEYLLIVMHIGLGLLLILKKNIISGVNQWCSENMKTLAQNGHCVNMVNNLVWTFLSSGAYSSVI